MSADSRRIMGAETALAVLMDAAMRDEAFFNDLTARVTVEAETVEAVLAQRLRPRWQVNTEGAVTFWLEGGKPVTEDEIQERRARYERFRDDSVFTGEAMLRLLEAAEAEQRSKDATTRALDAYRDLALKRQNQYAQAIQQLRAEQEAHAALIGLLATLFPASYEQNTADFDRTADWLLIIDLPTGQVAFPYDDMALPTTNLPFNAGRVYDGHTLADREARIRRLITFMRPIREEFLAGRPGVGELNMQRLLRGIAPVSEELLQTCGLPDAPHASEEG